MITILQLFSELSTGGGVRAALALAKHSARQGNYRHIIGQIRAAPIGKDVIDLAKDHGVEILPPCQHDDLCKLMAAFDIVQINWWNSAVMYEFMQKPLPPLRLMGWFHVGGQDAPQLITDAVLDYFDLPVACSPFTFAGPTFQKLVRTQSKRCAMAYGAADFDRLEGVVSKPHQGFNVGYIGTVHYLKMHPEYYSMSASIDIPDVRFVICGGGGAEKDIAAKAEAAGLSARFDVRGYVHDIKSVIEELDIYGYPLCPGNYAASEVNLQEVMYAGIPAVVFPYGGVKHLIENHKTGIVVNSAQEYKQAIEYLYNHPEERQRLGQNAREYARRVFGAENAARVFNPLYEEIFQQPKTNRSFQTNARNDNGDPISGAALLAESMAQYAEEFWVSLLSNDEAEVLAAESRIEHCNEVVRSNGILSYMYYFEKDAHLKLWTGLAFQGIGRYAEAAGCFSQALANGLTHWRVFWYMARATYALGQLEVAQRLLEEVTKIAPEYVQARTMLSDIVQNTCSRSEG